MNHNCRYCKRKYARETKLAEHIETAHPFASEYSNRAQLDEEDRLTLLHLLEKYVSVASAASALICDENVLNNAIMQYINWNGSDSINKLVVFVWVSHMLMPQNYRQHAQGKTLPSELGDWFNNAPDWFAVDSSAVPSTLFSELNRIVKIHFEFCRRATDLQLFQKAISSPQQIDALFDDFQRFLNLGMTWSMQNFCPSLPIDLVWHASMTNNAFYNRLCTKFIGRSLPHCLEENDQQHETRYAEFLRQFSHQHRREPVKIVDVVIQQQQENVFFALAQSYIDKQEQKIEEEKAYQAKLIADRKEEEQRREQQRLAEELAWKQRVAMEKAQVEAEQRAFRAMTPQQKQAYQQRKAKEEEDRRRQQSYTSREDSQC